MTQALTLGGHKLQAGDRLLRFRAQQAIAEGLLPGADARTLVRELSITSDSRLSGLARLRDFVHTVPVSQ